ncbi:MAG: T9SS type A sorting domain-containing protein [Bacteroidota bacterium]
MKNRIFNLANTFVVLFLLLGSSLCAQSNGATTGHEGNGGDANDAIVMDFEKGGPTTTRFDVPFRITVYAANLDYNGSQYILPSGAEAIYIAYDYGGVTTGRVEFSSFRFSHYGSGTPIYKSSRTVLVDWAEFCRQNEGATGLPYSLQMQTVSRDEYPVNQYFGPNEIFPCRNFSFPGCEGSHVSNSENVNVDGVINESCGTTPFGSDPEGEGRERSSELSSQQSLETLISPNPFDAHLQIQLSSQRSSELDIRMIDASGQQVYANKIGVDASSSHYIDASQWADGLYFCQIHSGSETKTFKVIKL